MFTRLILLAALLSPGLLHGQTTFPLRYDEPTVHARNLELGRLAGSALSSDGSVYLTDIDNAVVLKFSPDGALEWKKGRSGDGPGEFRVPYRIAVQPDGSAIAIYDIATNAISTFTRDGMFVDRRTVPFPFAQIDGMLIFEDGSTVLAGVTNYGGTARDHALHLFDDSLRHIRSFGALPAAEDREVLNYWGAGGISRSTQGSILYTQRIPYRIYEYTPTGILKQDIVPPFRLDGRPDDAIVITREVGNFSVEEGQSVTRPTTARQLSNGMIVSGRFNRSEGQWIDAFNRKGDYIGSIKAEHSWQTIFGYDSERRIGWATGLVDLEPVLFRVPVAY